MGRGGGGGEAAGDARPPYLPGGRRRPRAHRLNNRCLAPVIHRRLRSDLSKDMFRNMSFKPRRLTDATVMRALAHPTRIELHELIAREGELTATEAGERLGLTPANVSYHLRQLARYGFIEEGSSVPGRARPWRVRSAGHAWDGIGADAETNAAASALTSV